MELPPETAAVPASMQAPGLDENRDGSAPTMWHLEEGRPERRRAPVDLSWFSQPLPGV
jgi:hypothetical protein